MVVGLGRFELPSRAPEAQSLDQASRQPHLQILHTHSREPKLLAKTYSKNQHLNVKASLNHAYTLFFTDFKFINQISEIYETEPSVTEMSQELEEQ